MLHQDNLTLLVVQCVTQKRLHVNINTAKNHSCLTQECSKRYSSQKKKKSSKVGTALQNLYNVIDIGESLCASITGCEIKNITCVCRAPSDWEETILWPIFMYYKSAILKPLKGFNQLKK